MSTSAPAASPRSGTGEATGRPALAYLFLVVVMLTWAGNAIIARAVRDDVPPFMLAFARWTGALVLMAPFIARRFLRDLPALRSRWRIVLLLGFFGIACFNACLYLGLHYTTASNGILIQAAVPPMILVANFLMFRQTAGPLQIVGVILSTAGVVLVVVRADWQVLLGLRFSIGDLLVLCGVVAWAIYTALLRLRPPVDPRCLLAATFVVGAVAMLPLAAGEYAQGERIAWHATTVGALLYVAIFPSLIGYLLYNISVDMIGAARAGQTITLMPILGAFLASGLLGEPLHGYHLAGIALILAGIVLSAISARLAPLD